VKYSTLLLLLFAVPYVASAKKFKTSYVSFDLMNNWYCLSEGSEWICKNKLNSKSTEASIILTAKEKGPSDNLAVYEQYLGQPRKIREKRDSDKWHTSKVFHHKTRVINTQPWVDGFHSGSEIKSYYTRYLATLKGSIGIVVSYTAHENHYNKYAADFAKSISSLRVLKTFVNSKDKGRLGRGGSQNFLDNMIDPDSELAGEGDLPEGGGGLISKLLKNKKMTGFSLLLLTVLAYLVYRRRQQKQEALTDKEKEGTKKSLSRIERIKRHKREATRGKEKRRVKKSKSRSRSRSSRRRAS